MKIVLMKQNSPSSNKDNELILNHMDIISIIYRLCYLDGPLGTRNPTTTTLHSKDEYIIPMISTNWMIHALKNKESLEERDRVARGLIEAWFAGITSDLNDVTIHITQSAGSISSEELSKLFPDNDSTPDQ